ncbi:hypothetical protein ABBQ32_009530 [Trebouxia sp. C0010 RCD-2024]
MQSTADTALGYMKAWGNKAKQYALNLTDIEIKTEQATNNDPWGPHGTAMGEIARASYDIDNYKQIMGVIARRLQDTEEDWRHVYKSLLLLEFMSKHGPQKVVEELVSNIGVVEKLQNFEYKDAKSKDWGLNVRNRAKELANFVLNPDRVRSERAKAKQNESKYIGVSNNDLRDSKDSFGSKDAFGSKASSGLGGGESALSKLPSTKSSNKYDDEPERTTRRVSGGYADEAVQATKARIEALKKETPVPDSPSKDSIPAKPLQTRPRPSPSVPDTKAPKKLSDVKVNANIAASLGNIKLASPAAPTSSGSAARGPAGGTTHMPAASAAAPSHMDLLGGLDAPAPAPASTQQASGSPGADVWSTFSTSRDAPAAAALDSFGADPFGAAPAPLPAGFDLFGAAPAASRPAASPLAAFPPSADPFASDLGRSGFGASSATGAGSSAVSDPFGLSTSQGKGPAPTSAPATPPSRALPEDMFAAPSSPAFGRGGFGVGPQHQQQGAPFGQMPPAYAQPGFGGFGGSQGDAFPPQAGAFPPRPQAGGPFGMAPQPGAFGGQGMQSSFGGQQAAFGGAADPFGSDSSFGSSFAQGTLSAQSPTVAKLSSSSPAAAASGGAKDPFADLSAFH